MGKRLIITVDTNPTNGFGFLFSAQVVDQATTNFFSGVFRTTPTAPDHILIGANRNASAQNMLAYLQGFTVPSYITFSRTDNVINMDVEPENSADGNIILSYSFGAQLLYEIISTNASLPLTYALVRSSYALRLTPPVLFDNVSLSLSLYSGDINQPPLVADYELSKQIIQLGQTSVAFNINHLIKENTNPSIDNYLLSGLQPTQPDATTWVDYDAICFLGNDNVFEVTGKLLGLYGYGYFIEGFNPQLQSKVLITNNNHRHFVNQDNRLYFITDGLTSLEVNGTPITVTADLDLNTEYVQSINIKDYDSGEQVVCEFVYGESETRTIIYNVLKECKYKTINCVFINKYGMPQSFFINKVSKYTDDIENEDYIGLISDTGIYSTNKHQYVTFNSNSRTKIDCNTDYLTDAENNTIKELLLSETIYFIEDGVVYPVTLESKSLAYKTQLNEKLVQYTMNFKYAFDNINNVQ